MLGNCSTVSYTNRASKVHYLPLSFRFPPLREGNRERRAYSVPPASRGNLKEGVINCCFCELWLGDRYYIQSNLICPINHSQPFWMRLKPCRLPAYCRARSRSP